MERYLELLIEKRDRITEQNERIDKSLENGFVSQETHHNIKTENNTIIVTLDWCISLYMQVNGE